MKRIALTFASFLAVGGLCTGLQYIMLVGLVRLVQLDPPVASTIGFVVSAVVNYILNYQYTFESHARHVEALPRFVTVASIGALFNTAIMYSGTRIFTVHYVVVQVFATVVVLFWNFIANLRWSFMSPR